MPARSFIAAAFAGLSAIAALLALGGCGSGGTRTVSVSDSQSSAGGVTGTAAATSSHSASAGTSGGSGATGPASSAGAQGAGGGPAFAAPGNSAGLRDAESVLAARGFQTLDANSYHSAQTLRVLIGARQGSTDAHVQQAFFFVGARFLGTDTSDPSAHIRVVTQGDTSITLAYALYRSGDALCCARGGEATVTYQLDNGRLRPQSPIPAATPGVSPGRE